MSMMDLPKTYGYIWLTIGDRLAVNGPANQLWDLVQRVAKLALAQLGETGWSDSVFEELMTRIEAARLDERKKDLSSQRAAKKLGLVPNRAARAQHPQ